MKKNKPENSINKAQEACFGPVELTAELAAFRDEMNDEMMAFFRSLPKSTHAAVVAFFMQHFKTPFLPKCNYFKNYFIPSWSIIHWLDQAGSGGDPLTHEERRQVISVHAMTLFLHPLDDHLNDGQLPATHLHLLLRSQAWLRLTNALEQLTSGIVGGSQKIQDHMDNYYACIGSQPATETLDGYCRHFRNQMATWMCAPTLMALKWKYDEIAMDALIRAYGSFGIAWRLLDDLQDAVTDFANGCRTAIFFSLSASIQDAWNEISGHSDDKIRLKIMDAIGDEDVIGRIKKRICRELTLAASTLKSINMSPMAREMESLARPFKTE